MEEFFTQTLASKYNFWAYIALMMIGLYAMIGKKNLIKKIVGMNIFQTAIILYYVSLAVKKGATIPILEHHAPEGGGEAVHGAEGAVAAAHDAATTLGHDAASAANDAGQAVVDAAHHAAVNAADYINPLPHVLMLTAIVVSVATLGVALALALRIHRRHGTLDEPEILENLRQ